MAPNIPPRTSVFLVPLLLVIVERLATMARGIADDPAGHIDKPPVFMPGHDPEEDGVPSEKWLRLPWVSRLNHLHVTNMALLTSAFIIVAATKPGLVRNVLAGVIAIVWVQLPLLEIDEYDEIQANVPTPWALYLHVAGTIAIAVFIMTSGRFTPGLFLSELNLFAPDPSVVFDHGQHVLGLVVMGALFLVTTFGYLRLFERQVRIAIAETDTTTTAGAS